MTGKPTAAAVRNFFFSSRILVVFSRTVSKKNEKKFGVPVKRNVEDVLACHSVNTPNYTYNINYNMVELIS